jgi:hypothetical protein
MLFYPQHAPVPAELRTDEFTLRPLLATDVELDYDAVMSSREMLRVWSQSDWPADDFMLQGNLQDLQGHEKDHIERKAFTFTMMNPTETECLGCVYIYSLEGLLKHLEASEAELAALDDYQANVSFWVRQSRLADELDRRLLAALVAWFERDWAFSRVLFDVHEQVERQALLLTEAGLEKLYVLGEGVKYWIYG